MAKSQMISHNLTGQHYGFSAVDLGELGATRYTLVTIVVDESPSVSSFKAQMEECIKNTIEGCKGTYADYLLVRVVAFNSTLREIHGFKMLQDIDPGDYDGCLRCQGGTLLYGSALNAIQASLQYGQDLAEQDFDVNAIVVLITDGLDNMSDDINVSPSDVLRSVREVEVQESLESILSILVGVGVGRYTDVQSYLNDFKNEAGLSQYISIDDATSGAMSRLAGFISKSVSSQSQALGTGVASQPLQF